MHAAGCLETERGWSGQAGGEDGRVRGLAFVSELSAMPGHLIRRVHQISTAIFSNECAPFGLTSVQFAALGTIRDNPDVDATRLSSLIAFDRSTIGSLLERLEVKGWIERTASPTDRRIKLLRVTPSGLAVIERADSAVLHVQDRLLVPLQPEDRAALVRILTELVQRHEHHHAG